MAGRKTTPLNTVFICSTALIAGCTSQVQAETKPKAKNVILFVGDGMGISTVTAARIFDGQSKGLDGEEHKLSFEKFDNVALITTYNLDSQVPDSAGTASAMNTGIKTQIGKINVTADNNYGGCGNRPAPVTIADLANKAGLSIGIVSTARITHATPAAVFGHSINRMFESDADLDDEAVKAGCTDLAAQLIVSDANYVLGGGAAQFKAKRTDGRDLTREWAEKSDSHAYVSNAEDLRALPNTSTDVLGLFTKSHMAFETDRDNAKEPSITEMTTLAIDNLAARDTGYFLMVEAGRIDHAHHGTNAYRALSDTQAFAKAIGAAVQATNPDDTLILVTADHSHVFTIAGYPKRGNPILGLVESTAGKSYESDKSGNPYTTLGYHNGPNVRKIGPDDILTQEQVLSPNYRQQTAVELDYETHAGEDVALYAAGPGSDAVSGVMDQTEIFGVITDALGISPKE